MSKLQVNTNQGLQVYQVKVKQEPDLTVHPIKHPASFLGRRKCFTTQLAAHVQLQPHLDLELGLALSGFPHANQDHFSTPFEVSSIPNSKTSKPMKQVAMLF